MGNAKILIITTHYMSESERSIRVRIPDARRHTLLMFASHEEHEERGDDEDEEEQRDDGGHAGI